MASCAKKISTSVSSRPASLPLVAPAISRSPPPPPPLASTSQSGDSPILHHLLTHPPDDHLPHLAQPRGRSKSSQAVRHPTPTPRNAGPRRRPGHRLAGAPRLPRPQPPPHRPRRPPLPPQGKHRVVVSVLHARRANPNPRWASPSRLVSCVCPHQSAGSLGAVAGFAIAVVFAWKFLRSSPARPRRPPGPKRPLVGPAAPDSAARDAAEPANPGKVGLIL